MGDITYLHSLLQANPTLYLDELQEQLYDTREVDVSIATIFRTLARSDLTQKQVAPAAAERDRELRSTWQAVNGDIPMDFIIWLDESSVDDLTNHRLSGWASLGRACVKRQTFLRGQRFSVLPALSTEGMIALEIFEGSVTKERFFRFIDEQIAPILTPYPGPRSVVILDNCAIHHDEELRRIVVEECNAKLVYLPPYSPDLNPIEQAFSSMKAWLRRHEAEAIRPEIRPWLIERAIESISSDDAVGWITNCGYS